MVALAQPCQQRVGQSHGFAAQRVVLAGGKRRLFRGDAGELVAVEPEVNGQTDSLGIEVVGAGGNGQDGVADGKCTHRHGHRDLRAGSGTVAACETYGYSLPGCLGIRNVGQDAVGQGCCAQGRLRGNHVAVGTDEPAFHPGGIGLGRGQTVQGGRSGAAALGILALGYGRRIRFCVLTPAGVEGYGADGAGGNGLDGGAGAVLIQVPAGEAAVIPERRGQGNLIPLADAVGGGPGDLSRQRSFAALVYNGLLGSQSLDEGFGGDAAPAEVGVVALFAPVSDAGLEQGAEAVVVNGLVYLLGQGAQGGHHGSGHGGAGVGLVAIGSNAADAVDVHARGRHKHALIALGVVVQVVVLIHAAHADNLRKGGRVEEGGSAVVAHGGHQQDALLRCLFQRLFQNF